MIKINSSSLRTSNDGASSANSNSDTSASNADPAGFASLLRQTQATETAKPGTAVSTGPQHGTLRLQPENAANAGNNDSAPDETDASKPEEAPAAPSDQTSANMNADATARARLLARAKLRNAEDRPSGQTKTTDTHDKASTTEGANPGDKSARTSAGNPLDPNLAQWLASLQQRPASDVAASGSTTPDDNAATLAASGKHTAAVAALKAEAALTGQAGEASGRFAEVLDKAVLDKAGMQAAAGDKSLTEAISTAAAIPKLNAEAMAAAAAGIGQTTNEIAAASEPVSVAIAAPVESPEFAQALGAQLSMLTRDGVQEAELHLNPADMGPVSVQIVMDGTQARIDFGADLAATRQAIEASLPALASALRDAGFTLAGGGVSQQSGQRSDGGSSDGQRRGNTRGGQAEGGVDGSSRIAGTPRRVAIGAVDRLRRHRLGRRGQRAHSSHRRRRRARDAGCPQDFHA